MKLISPWVGGIGIGQSTLRGGGGRGAAVAFGEYSLKNVYTASAYFKGTGT